MKIITLPIDKVWEMRKKGSIIGDMTQKRTDNTTQAISQGMRAGRLDPIEASPQEYKEGVLHEGKHRLIIAKKLGYKTYPILISKRFK